MPYIKQKRRREIDGVIKLMRDCGIKADGDLNYILYSYCYSFIPQSYNDIKNFCGELRQCATEIERRILGSYEDEMIKKNGDIGVGGD